MSSVFSIVVNVYTVKGSCFKLHGNDIVIKKVRHSSGDIVKMRQVEYVRGKHTCLIIAPVGFCDKPL